MIYYVHTLMCARVMLYVCVRICLVESALQRCRPALLAGYPYSEIDPLLTHANLRTFAKPNLSGLQARILESNRFAKSIPDMQAPQRLAVSFAQSTCMTSKTPLTFKGK